MSEPPWVIVAGGFHQLGGMDKANASLADYLIAERVRVHLVAHDVDDRYRHHTHVHVHLMRRPMNSFLLGGRLLAAEGRRIARDVTARHAGARVVVNGGNCAWPDVNWVHYVHHAWSDAQPDRPATFRLQRFVAGRLERADERRALAQARVTLANSDSTRNALIGHLGLDAATVRTLYLGADPAWIPPEADERSAARAWLGVKGQPVVSFVGALGYDDRKGFGTLLDAWAGLSADAAWDAHLVVAGSGRALPRWQARVDRLGLSHRIRFLGHTPRVAEVLAASDLLVSPVRYEPYGLNVQEALCRGVPAIVSRLAGVAEQYPAGTRHMLLERPLAADELARKLMAWRRAMDLWRHDAEPIGTRLRAYTWREMARRMTQLVASAPTATSDALTGRVSPWRVREVS